MEAEIRPHAGAGPFRFGMPAGEARAAVAEWGVILADQSSHAHPVDEEGGPLCFD